MANRIEQVIGDIEEYIDGCKMAAFSNTKIIVDRPQIEEYLDELRQYTPEEVKKYQRMLNNRDKIISDAKQKAQDIEERAQNYADKLVSENNITKMAYDKATEILNDANAQAKQIVEQANNDATTIRTGAFSYTNEMLRNVLSIISGSVDDAQEKYRALISSLSEHQAIVSNNLRELNGQSPVPADSFNPEKEEPEPFFEATFEDE
ncbi:MAG: hypothetical protein II601_01725 [Lachnospiraceae bacterium]|jgi:cell division septum initiation protein DivIVA|nr:hypothetical protein [Lachnospiraceae bacterium]MBQ6541546.1 hypothetical protein [Lachnospiraceae bacterium]MBQ7601883.1 hypothetical protein [Lachnospiraceae bacterium]MBR5338574.1 hypothetical protein [Lachnospiraceae bacterium]